LALLINNFSSDNGNLSFLTADFVVLHSREDEADYSNAILSLGKKWQNVFNTTSMLLLFLLGVIHFIFIADTLYLILQNIIPDTSTWAKSDKFSFSSFSLQYIGFIIFSICVILYCFKDLRRILIINDKGVYIILAYYLFVIYLSIYVLFRSDVSFDLASKPGKVNKGLSVILFT
jgi:amino acid permease